MKAEQISNGLLTIQANENKDGDYALSIKIAEQMVEDSQETIVMCSADDAEQWVQVSANWLNFQAKELNDAYKDARRKVLARG